MQNENAAAIEAKNFFDSKFNLEGYSRVDWSLGKNNAKNSDYPIFKYIPIL